MKGLTEGRESRKNQAVTDVSRGDNDYAKDRRWLHFTAGLMSICVGAANGG